MKVWLCICRGEVQPGGLCIFRLLKVEEMELEEVSQQSTRLYEEYHRMHLQYTNIQSFVFFKAPDETMFQEKSIDRGE